MKNKRGITLIALVITIIVLLILAGVSISLTLGQNGVLSKAGESNKKYIEEEAGEQIKLAYNDYKIDKLTNSTSNYTFEEAVEKIGFEKVEVDGNDMIGYDVLATLKNNSEKLYHIDADGNITISDIKWKFTDNGKITDGTTTLEIGDFIKYDHTKDKNGNTITGEKASYTSYSVTNASPDKNNGRTNGTEYDYTISLSNYPVAWRVFGITKKGELKLISEKPYADIPFKGINGLLYGKDELNAICKMFSQGKGANDSRSINETDLNEFTGYDPQAARYRVGERDEYGNEITFYWLADSYLYEFPHWKYKKGDESIDSLIDSKYENGFYYFDSNGLQISPFLTSKDNAKQEITVLKQNYYKYYLSSLSSQLLADDTSTIQYKMLNSWDFWLASTCTDFSNDRVVLYGLRAFGRLGASSLPLYLGFEYLLTSKGDEYYGRNHIFPIVILSSDTQIVKDETDHNGSTQEKACLIQ